MSTRTVAAVTLALTMSPVAAHAGGGGDPIKPARVTATAGLQAKTYAGNRIGSVVSNRGMLARQPSGHSGFEFPRRSGKYAIYAAGPWFGGYVGGQLRTAVAEYTSDFRGGAYGATDEDNWPVLRLTRSGLTRLLDAVPANDSAVPVDERADFARWLSYPGSPRMIDTTLGGPHFGRIVPMLTGDETLYTIYHDGGPGALTDTVSVNNRSDAAYRVFNTRPLDIEIRQTVFGYDRPGALNRAMFVRYTLYNRGTQAIDSLRIGLWADPDLGDAGDDLVGFDVPRQLTYVYNGFHESTGDHSDAIYGPNVPAVGWAFLQGPLVPDAGATGSAFGQTRPGYRNLTLSAGPDLAKGNEARTAIEAYRQLSGLRREGFQFPELGRITYDGDPVTGTGSLDGVRNRAYERQWLGAVGPFTLASGDSQDVITAFAVGDRNGDPIHNITDLRSVVDTANLQRRVGFPEPPLVHLPRVAFAPDAPAVTVTNLNQQVVLSWTDDARGYERDGYRFIGYRVYQLSDSADVKPALLTDWRAADGRLRQFQITGDAFTGAPLVNGQTYRFAVTAIAEDPLAEYFQTVTESALRAIEARPSNGVTPGRTALVGRLIPLEQIVGIPPDADPMVRVLDPTALTGHRYTIRFDSLAQPFEFQSTLRWAITLTDETTGRVVLDRDTTLSADPAETRLIDGFWLSIGQQQTGLGPYDGTTNGGFAYLAAVPNREPTFASTRQFATSIPGISYPSPFDGIVAYPFVSNGHDFSYFGNITDIRPDQLMPVEVVIDSSADGSSKAYRYLRRATAAFVGDGSEADLVKVKMAGYPYQDTREIPVKAYKLIRQPDGSTVRQQVDLGFLENNESIASGNGALNGKWDPQTVAGGGREVLFIFDQAYSNGANPLMTNALSAFQGVSYIFTPKRRYTDNPEIFRSGDRIRITPFEVNDSGDTYRFDTGALLTAVRADAGRPVAFRLLPAAPNPFNPTTTIRFQLPTAGRTSLVVYDLLGRAVRRVLDEPMSAGDHAVDFTADGLPSGVYLVRLAAGDRSETRRVTLLR